MRPSTSTGTGTSSGDLHVNVHVHVCHEDIFSTNIACTVHVYYGVHVH